ncbi:MAG: ACP S-malonyltransferase [Gammaproteobacteria bacterium]
MNFAAVFPGQGSQSVGMLSGLAELAETRPLLAESSKALGYDLGALIATGPAERLNSTECAQPALLVAGYAAWLGWRARGGLAPAYMAGHSLGEYTALVSAGALEFTEAVKLVEYRGQAMQAAVPAGAGAMAAVLGLADAVVGEACAAAAEGGVVAAANFNAPGQVVISGQASAVARASERCKQAGAKRVILLPVSVPSHCELMRPAAVKLAARLERLPLRTPKVPVVHNVDVRAHTDPADIRRILTAQLFSPVRWVETVQYLAAQGVTHFIEFGSGRVLTGLIKRIDKSLVAYSAYDLPTLEAALNAVRAS